MGGRNLQVVECVEKQERRVFVEGRAGCAQRFEVVEERHSVVVVQVLDKTAQRSDVLGDLLDRCSQQMPNLDDRRARAHELHES